MSRKSIFDLERRVDLRNAYNTVIGDLKTTIVNPNAYIGKTLLSCLDAGIKTWPYRNAANTIEMYARSHGFSFYGRNDSDMSVIRIIIQIDELRLEIIMVLLQNVNGVAKISNI